MGKTLTYGEFKFGKSPARPTSKGYAKGGETKGQAKVAKVMGEFKSGELHSGSKKGPVVKNPKQAIAIALSEKKSAGYKQGGKVGLWDNIHAKRERIENGSGEHMRKPGSKGAPTDQDFKHASAKMKEGGKAKLTGAKREPDAVVKKEVAILKKAGAPAKIIKHEEKEIAKPMMKKGGKVKKYADGGVAAKSPMTEKERQQASVKKQKSVYTGQMTEGERRQMAKEEEMDRRMRQAERDAPTNQRMLDEAMNPLSMLKEAYDKITDRSGRSATDNMQRYGMKEGGLAKHEDIAQDKPMIKKMIHKHEQAMHAGEPLTKLAFGGDAGYQRQIQMQRMQQQQQQRQAQMQSQRTQPMGGSLGGFSNWLRSGNSQSTTTQPTTTQPTTTQPTPVTKPTTQTAPKTVVNTSGLGFRKGGTAKKGVPVHKRNAKIC